MKEEKGIRHRGRGAHLLCPVFTTVHFSLRNEGSSEYIRVCEGREILRPNFKLLRTPGINSTELIPYNLSPLSIAMVVAQAHQATYAGGIDSFE